MADNVTLPGTGIVVDTRDIGSGVERQVVETHDDLFHTSLTFTPNSAAYVAGYCLGGEKNLTGFSRGTNGILKRALLRANFAISAPVYLYLFGDNPSETYTDHAAMPTIGSTSLGFLIKTIPFLSWDQRGASQTLYQAEYEGVDVPFSLVTAGSVYFAMEIAGTPTPGATKTIWVDFWSKG